MLLGITITLLPLLLVGITIVFYRQERRELTPSRRVLFLLGVAAASISAAVLSTFSIHAWLASGGTQPVDLDRIYPVFSMMAFGVLAVVFGCCGRRVSRSLLSCDGLITVGFWYVVALAVSP